jgi:hypothetical protein
MARAGFPVKMRWGGERGGTLFRQLLGTASPVLLTTCALHGAAWTDLAVASYVPGTNARIAAASPLLYGSAVQYLISGDSRTLQLQ